MRADRQVRVIAPGKGPMGHRQRLAALPGEALPQQQRQQGQCAGGQHRAATRRLAVMGIRIRLAPPQPCGGQANASAALEASARCPAREPSRPGKPCARDQPKATSPATPASVQAEAQASRARPAPPAPARAARDQASMAAAPPPPAPSPRYSPRRVQAQQRQGAMPQRRQLRIAPMTRIRQVIDDLVLDAPAARSAPRCGSP